MQKPSYKVNRKLMKQCYTHGTKDISRLLHKNRMGLITPISTGKNPSSLELKLKLLHVLGPSARPYFAESAPQEGHNTRFYCSFIRTSRKAWHQPCSQCAISCSYDLIGVLCSQDFSVKIRWASLSVAKGGSVKPVYHNLIRDITCLSPILWLSSLTMA